MAKATISKDEKHARNRAKLTEAAQEVLLRQGYGRSSLRDVASAAGVPLGTLHYYFTDRSELMIAAFRDHQLSFLTAMTEIAESDADPAARCALMAASWTRQIEQNRHGFRLWYDLRNQGLFSPELRPVISEMEALRLAAMRRLVGVGPDHPEQIARIASHYIPLLGGLIQFALQRLSFDEPLDLPQIEASLCEVLLQLLAEVSAPLGRAAPEVSLAG